MFLWRGVKLEVATNNLVGNVYLGSPQPRRRMFAGDSGGMFSFKHIAGVFPIG
jgi:hypothetical protein